MKNIVKVFYSSLSFVLSFVLKAESLWSLKNIIYQKNNNMENISSISMSQSYFWIYQVLVGMFFGVVTYIILDKLGKNRERTNIFHWIYNYRFEMLEEKFNKEFKDKKNKFKIDFFSKKELKFIIKKIKKKYPKKNAKEIIELLKPHYSRYLDKEYYYYINLIEDSVK